MRILRCNFYFCFRTNSLFGRFCYTMSSNFSIFFKNTNIKILIFIHTTLPILVWILSCGIVGLVV